MVLDLLMHNHMIKQYCSVVLKFLECSTIKDLFKLMATVLLYSIAIPFAASQQQPHKLVSISTSNYSRIIVQATGFLTCVAILPVMSCYGLVISNVLFYCYYYYYYLIIYFFLYFFFSFDQLALFDSDFITLFHLYAKLMGLHAYWPLQPLS